MAGSPVLIFFPLVRHRGGEGGVFNIEKKVSRQINLICLILLTKIKFHRLREPVASRNDDHPSPVTHVPFLNRIKTFVPSLNIDDLSLSVNVTNTIST
jgi:hypothetical protein